MPLLDKAVFGLQIGKLSKWILDVVVYGNGFIWIDLRVETTLSSQFWATLSSRFGDIFEIMSSS